MDKIIKELGLDNELNKNHFRQKKYNKVWLETKHKEDYNMMADLISFPTSKEGYKYLFAIVDLYTLEFDCEPVKTKEAKEVLQAMLKCFKRKYINEPYASIATDGGSEFKGVFHKWVFDENIYHKVGIPYRHRQQSVIESLNRSITKIIMLYLNKKCKENNSREPYTNWVEILPAMRESLNNHRKRLFEKLKKKYLDSDGELKEEHELLNQKITKYPKFKIGQFVHWKLDYPENFNLEKQSTPAFRSGDYRYSTTTRKIKKLILMSSYPYYRYILEDKPDVSYSEYELIPAKVNYSTYIVNKIIDKKTVKGKIYYKVWWLKELKKNATWEPKTNLIEDGLKDYVEFFENELKEKLAKDRQAIKDKQLKDYEKSLKKKNKN